MATSISPSEIERLAKRVTDLDRQSEYLRIWLYIWTAAVAVGLILEYRKEFIRLGELLWIYITGRVPFEWWRIRALIIAIGAGTLVTVGVMGELGIEFRQSGLETELAATNGKLTGDLGELAKDAADNASDALRDANTAMMQVGTVEPKARAAEEASKTAISASKKAEGTASSALTMATAARQKADTVEKQAAESEARLTSATTDLASAQRILELSFRRRSPREGLLHDADIAEDLRLRPFREQKVTILSCWPEQLDTPEQVFRAFFKTLGSGGNPIDRERNDAVHELGFQLTRAHWDPDLGVEFCASVFGIQIQLDPTANDRTRLAAEQLSQVLHDALLIEGRGPLVFSLSLGRDQLRFINDGVHSFVVTVGDNPFQ
ncbi:MAG TPA: hypothetical protein VMH80_23835 [Bryobacteraceae bacterium]|nr:hypothetical protein [Bryobacteraceae bacterium]